MAKKNGKRKSAKPGELKNADGTVVCGSLKSNGSGDLCQSAVVMANGRCEKHGGKSIPPGPGHPTFKHGRRSKLTARLPARLRDGFEASIADPEIVSVRNELALLDSRVLELLDRLSGEGLDALVAAVNAISDAPDEAEEVVAEARALIQQIRSEASTWGEIRTTVEVRRRLSNSERKLLEHKQAVVEISELRAIVAFLLQSVKDHVLALDGGREAVLGISGDVAKLMLPGGATEAPRA